MGSQGKCARQRAALQADPTKIPACQFTELLPKLAQVNDKVTMIRSMSYTPIGLFNHTAAIYQMLPATRPTRSARRANSNRPAPRTSRTSARNIIRLKPPDVPMLPFVMMPRPLQESGVVGKGGTAGFLGRAYDPYTLYPPGDDMDMNKMDRVQDRRPPIARGGVALRLDARQARNSSTRDAGHRKGDQEVQSR